MVNQEFKIRDAKLSDFQHLLRLESDLIDVERHFDQAIKSEKILYYNLPEIINSPNYKFLIAETDHNIIACGYVCIIPSKPHLKHSQQGLINFVFVDADFRGMNIALKIIKRLKVWCFKKGIMEIGLEVYSQNISAIKAYKKAGFEDYRVEMKLSLK